jgi:hypothetical protein
MQGKKRSNSIPFFIHLVLLLLALNSNHLMAIESKVSIHNDSIRFAVYVDNIFNVDYDNSSYDIIFYLWYNSIGERYSLDDIDVMNAIEKTLLYEELDSTESNGQVYYSDIRKYKCAISNNLFMEIFHLIEIS